MRCEVWVIEPRDPLVVRDGRGFAESGANASFPFPLPNTIAGMARASFVGRRSDVGAEEARQLLSIRVTRGPLLVHRSGANLTHWTQAPGDAVTGRFDVNCRRIDAMARACVIRLDADEGVLWAKGTPVGLGLVMLPAIDHEGRKTKPLADGRPFWPLAQAVEWATGRAPYVELSAMPCGMDPLQEESRLHVAIDDESQTAEPGMLYGTPGIRFADGFGIGIEVEADEGLDWPAAGFVQLGGEARPSFRTTEPQAAFPLFDVFQEQYKAAARQGPAGLRLELLTPAWLHDGAGVGEAAWLPSWIASGIHPRLPGIRLELAAVCLHGSTAISGWNIQGGKDGTGAPRAVRRLVPAGSVFYFRVPDGKREASDFVSAARALWAAPIELEGAAHARDDFLAPAARDGFGLVLPGFWWEGEGSKQPGGER
jgi:CRISPR-associated protein Cmr3